MDAEKILVRGVNWLGDAVMTLPALRRLREAKPDAHVAILTPEKLAEVWEDQSIVDEVIEIGPAETLWGVGRRLRAERFDIAVAFPNSMRSAVELWLSGARRRIGAAGAPRSLLLTDAVEPHPGAVKMRKRSEGQIRRALEQGTAAQGISTAAHHAHQYLHLTARLGASEQPIAPQLAVSGGDVESALAKFALERNGLRWGLAPGGEYGPAKRWPRERFVEAAAALQKQVHCQWLVFGGQGDVDAAGWVADGIRRACGADAAVNLAGRTRLRELMALLSACKMVLTNDTGPMHLAAALGVRVVAIFGSTSPELTGPIFSASASIVRSPPPCSPCFRRDCPVDLRCLNGVGSNEVIRAVLRGM